jgi:hypothetical protein
VSSQFSILVVTLEFMGIHHKGRQVREEDLSSSGNAEVLHAP